MKIPAERWLVVVLVLGAALRLYSYVANPSLSVDDAMLTLNVASRSFLGLLKPLSLEQTAPPLFLWGLKAATIVAGVRDPVLRFLPLVAGLVLPFAVWRVAGRLTRPGAALVASAFSAFALILVQYSVSAKPYTVDALVTVLLVGATLRVLEAPGATPRWVLLGVGGMSAVLCSTPAVFVLGGCGLALVASPEVRAQRGAPQRLVVLAVLWVAVFATVYFAIARAEADSAYMQAFWDQKFLTPDALLHPGHAWDLFGRLPVESFVPAQALPGFPLALWLVTGWGFWCLSRTSWSRAALVAGPVLMVLLASAMHRYPLAPRVLVFAAPLFHLAAAAAVDRALGVRSRTGRVATATVVGLWLVTLLGLAVNTRFWAPPTRQLVAEARIQANGGGHEPVYLFAGAVPFWLVYATDWRHPDTAFINAVVQTQAATGNAFHNAASRGRAVADTEGEHDRFTVDGRTLLVGLSPGIQWREGHGFNQRNPDANWGAREAVRMRAVTDSTVLVALAHLYTGERGALSRALELAGGRRELLWEKRGAALERYRFTPGGP